jgi:hypothetical protein
MRFILEIELGSRTGDDLAATFTKLADYFAGSTGEFDAGESRPLDADLNTVGHWRTVGSEDADKLKAQPQESTVTKYGTVIDGTENDGFTLMGSGQNAPFYLFNIDKQDWTHGPFPTRIEAEVYASTVASSREPYAEIGAEVLETLRALTDWARENTSPRDANSPHDILIRTAAVIDEADKLKAETTYSMHLRLKQGYIAATEDDCIPAGTTASIVETYRSGNVMIKFANGAMWNDITPAEVESLFAEVMPPQPQPPRVNILIHSHRHGEDVFPFTGGDKLEAATIAARLGVDYEEGREDESLETRESLPIPNVDELPDPKPETEEGE